MTPHDSRSSHLEPFESLELGDDPICNRNAKGHGAAGLEESSFDDPQRTESSLSAPGGQPSIAKTVEQTPIGSVVQDRAPFDQGASIGRYRIERLIGSGGFGSVYLAQDVELNRWVAIKVPHAHRLSGPADVDRFFYEARILAGLDHSAIVPIYDVGRVGIAGSVCFLVSKHIDGISLEQRLRQGRPKPSEAAAWIATVAEALHYAHSKGIIHRDVKPANLLLDVSGQLYLADFGLALRENDLVASDRFTGTPAYTSPEQARREGHRIDARSDLFSLGVVFYKLLTGINPFKGSDHHETLRNIVELHPRPPREMDLEIPEELDRICQKAIAKRNDDRYPSAYALAFELRQWLQQEGSSAPRCRPVKRPQRPIVPRGLRPYEAADAEFFLDLLPGPRGRDNLPESLRFWKDRIEATAGAGPFPVGVLYGPTGSGKSSLARSGLLPRLADHVRCVYVESTAEETESRLLQRLRSEFPELAREPDLDLASILREVRQGRGLEKGQKVLIVLDQFEQWLFERPSDQRKTLEDALRQCDGHRVQALLLVRDEFWMALTRFARELEIRLVDGENIASTDLFDFDHARRVLHAIGLAHGRWAEDLDDLGPHCLAFLDQAVEGLAQDGRVVCVRLALFAELLKERPWVPATLRDLGGVSLVGVAYLEAAFFAPTAPPQNRFHQKAACEVLRRLLPRSGVAIKGHCCSRNDLLEASGYAHDPQAFDELLRILDHQLRLITPVDASDTNASGQAPTSPPKSYQLTHDYLIPDLREWLHRHQQGTIRGRAELRLQEFAELWAKSKNAKVLPTSGEWLALRLLTKPQRWTSDQRQMMRVCAGRHARRGLIAAVVLCGLLGFGFWQVGQMQALALVEKLGAAEVDQVASITQELGPHRQRVHAILRERMRQQGLSDQKRLNWSMALVAVDPGQVDELVERLLVEDLVTSLTIREVLIPYREIAADRLWAVALDHERPESARLRAAMALSLLDPPDAPESTSGNAKCWHQIASPTAEALVSALDTNPVYFSPVVQAVEPIQKIMIAPLEAIYCSENEGRRSMTTSILAALAHDDPDVLTRLVLDADVNQFRRLAPFFDRHRSQILHQLVARLGGAEGHALAPPIDEDDARRRAIAVLCLLRAGDPRTPWEAFQNAPDPALRTHMIHNAEAYGVPLATLTDRLRIEEDLDVIRGLLLTIGQYKAEKQPARVRQHITSMIRDRFLTHEDAGVHGAAEWTLKNWGFADLVVSANGLLELRQEPRPASWYVSKEGHLMIVIDARHVPDIGRVFALASKETTLKQMRRHHPGYFCEDSVIINEESPVGVVTWMKAVEYCEWLNSLNDIPNSQSCYSGPRDRTEGDLIHADLDRTGYRLPTQAEWEYACRAGTVTRRHFGDRDDLLDHYAWFQENANGKLWPVGERMPNDFGFFDLYGNVSEWTSDIRPGGDRAVMVGGNQGYPQSKIDSSIVAPSEPFVRFNSYGFRVARTIKFED